MEENNLKKMRVYFSNTTRGIVDYANNNNIERNDVVTIIRDAITQQYTLIYYK